MNFGLVFGLTLDVDGAQNARVCILIPLLLSLEEDFLLVLRLLDITLSRNDMLITDTQPMFTQKTYLLLLVAHLLPARREFHRLVAEAASRSNTIVLLPDEEAVRRNRLHRWHFRALHFHGYDASRLHETRDIHTARLTHL